MVAPASIIPTKIVDYVLSVGYTQKEWITHLITNRKECTKHIKKNDIPAKFDVPGAVARQTLEFGDATNYGTIAGEYFSLGAGTDITPLLKGLEGDLCQSPHWGYMIEGEVTLTYSDGQEETTSEGDLFYWPAGHTLRVGKDAEIVLFSPQHDHCKVVDHVKDQLVQ